jgi:hypothetical protein
MDEELKQQLMPALVVFNMTVVGYLLIRVVYPMFVGGQIFDFGRFFVQAMIGVVIGLVTGGITLAVTMRKK